MTVSEELSRHIGRWCVVLSDRCSMTFAAIITEGLCTADLSFSGSNVLRITSGTAFSPFGKPVCTIICDFEGK